ncbi:MAG: YceD family protein, partial [Candidatus Binatia bacterium]
EMGLSFYSSNEIDLSPLMREQVLLALPTRPLCDDLCRGLCAGCGVNLNHESCLCPPAPGDPRMAVFRTLKLGQQ